MNLSEGGKLSPAIGKSMRDVLAHGGPDDAGEFFDDDVYLGHRRLAVIDVSPAGHQPMHFNEWAIVFNGEIYNHAEIAVELEQAGYRFSSHSDTEVILKAFDCWSYKAVEKFRGMFAFALWNKLTRKLILCRDRVGVKPLYWYQKDHVFLFGSELKALREYPDFDIAIDHSAVSLFLQTGYIPSPRSIYKYAQKLKPGHFLEIDNTGKLKTWPYWDVHKAAEPNTNYSNDEAAMAKAEHELIEACMLRMVADVPVGVFLSGGIDSSLVTALLQKNNTDKIKTFTIGFEDAAYDESVIAKKIADYLGTDHYEYTCRESDFLKVIDHLPDMYDEPFGDSSAIPTHLVAAMARERVTVALSADGGDEVFAGYDRYQLADKLYKKIRYIPLGIRKVVAALLLKTPPKYIESVVTALPGKKTVRGLEWRLPKLAESLTARSAFDFYKKSVSIVPARLLIKLHKTPIENLFAVEEELCLNNFYAGLGKADITTYLEGDIMAKVDRATMQVALEGREPLLDHKVIEFGLSLPDDLKVRNGKGKWILRELLYQYVPKELVDRPKQGFGIPIKTWLQQNLKSYVDDMQADVAFIEFFKFDQDVLQQTISKFYEPGKASVNPYFIWSLYNLYRWYLRWIKTPVLN